MSQKKSSERKIFLQAHKKALCLLLLLAVVLTTAGCGVQEAAATENVEPEQTPVLEEETIIQDTQEELEWMPPEPCEDHVWEDGICLQCGIKCEHPEHDDSAVCTICGLQRWHVYDVETKTCKICGHKWVPESWWLEEEWYLPDATLKGNTQQFDVSTPNLGKHASKKIEVYTPYNYNPDEQYDVLIMFCGLQSPFNSFTSDVKYDYRKEQDKSIVMRNIWDNMIERGYCEPMIICSVSTYTANASRGQDIGKDFEPEGRLDKYGDTLVSVRDYIFPFIIDNFYTYAASSAPEDIIAARRHFCIGGFSNGAYFTVYSAMPELNQYASSFFPIAGSHSGHGTGIAVHEAWDKYPLDLLYFACGRNDNLAYEKTRKDYLAILQNCEELVEGVNAYWDEPTDFSHDWDTGSTVCFNAVQLLFGWNQ